MSTQERTPVIVVVGHIDHGKSKLLDYIRKTNVVDKEAGGITQHISAYEVDIKNKEGKSKKVTFLDTPGHEAFSKMRTRGCVIADIAILIVSAEEGVKAQTVEALKSIKKCNIPFVVAINKIDKPEANVEKTKNFLLEHEVYLEGLGGDVPYIPISAITGEGVPELLEMILLVAELEELKGDTDIPAEGFVIEANTDSKRGISATLVVKDGTLKSGMRVVSGKSQAPVRIMENFIGVPIKEASFSEPINIVGWSELPEVGARFKAYKNKKEAEKAISEFTPMLNKDIVIEKISETDEEETKMILPIIIKADTKGSVEAIEGELSKIEVERVVLKIIGSGTGNITENDVKTAGSGDGSIILGFHVKEDRGIPQLADRMSVEIKTFDIIYKLTEWLEKTATEKRPKIRVEEIRGKSRILKIFSKAKDKQVIGGEVFEGNLSKGDKVKILRRGEEIGTGVVLGLQSGKAETNSVSEGSQFGAKVESGIEIAEKDNFESISLVEK